MTAFCQVRCKYMQNWKLLPRSFADLYSLRVWSPYPVICPVQNSRFHVLSIRTLLPYALEHYEHQHFLNQKCSLHTFQQFFLQRESPGFLSYMLSSIGVGRRIWGLNVQFLRVLSGFLNNPFYTQHFRTTVLGAAASLALNGLKNRLVKVAVVSTAVCSRQAAPR